MPTDTVFRALRGRGARRIAAGTVLAVSAMALSACDKKPGGQVAAVVNSEEITQQELRAEAEAAGVPAGQDLQSYAPAVLDRVIQRNLLADYAKEKDLNRGPEFVARRRQMEQALLANLAMRQIVAGLGAPAPADVKGFIDKNPAMFARREILALDQVRFAAPTDTAQIRSLVALDSIEAVLARLNALKVPAARGTSKVDTGTIESAVARQLTALPNGRLFDLTINGTTMISAITGRSPAPTAQASWSGIAAQAFQRERAQKALVDAMNKMRSSAKIDYDPAFRPVTAAK